MGLNPFEQTHSHQHATSMVADRRVRSRRALTISIWLLEVLLAGHPRVLQHAMLSASSCTSVPGEYYNFMETAVLAELEERNTCPEGILNLLRQDMEMALAALCHGITLQEPLLAGRLVGTGSFHEGTQVGLDPSSFDLDYLWEVDALSANDTCTLRMETLQHTDDWQLDAELLRLRYSGNGEERDVNMRKLRDRFANAVGKVVADPMWRLQHLVHRLSLDSANSTSHEVGLVKLAFRWQGWQSAKERDVLAHVDLSPAARSTAWDVLKTPTFQKFPWPCSERKLRGCREIGFHLLPSLSSHMGEPRPNSRLLAARG